MKNYILRYGVIGGCVNIALGLTNWFTVARLGTTVSQAVGWISIILALMCVPLGIRYFRDKLNGGKVGFGDAFKTGFGITFVFTFLTGLYSILFFIFAGDSFEEWQKQGLSESELRAFELQMEQTPAIFLNPVVQGLIFFAIIFVMGMIVNLISSLILRRSE